LVSLSGKPNTSDSSNGGGTSGEDSISEKNKHDANEVKTLLDIKHNVTAELSDNNDNEDDEDEYEDERKHNVDDENGNLIEKNDDSAEISIKMETEILKKDKSACSQQELEYIR